MEMCAESSNIACQRVCSPSSVLNVIDSVSDSEYRSTSVTHVVATQEANLHERMRKFVRPYFRAWHPDRIGEERLAELRGRVEVCGPDDVIHL